MHGHRRPPSITPVAQILRATIKNGISGNCEVSVRQRTQSLRQRKITEWEKDLH